LQVKKTTIIFIAEAIGGLRVNLRHIHVSQGNSSQNAFRYSSLKREERKKFFGRNEGNLPGTKKDNWIGGGCHTNKTVDGSRQKALCGAVLVHSEENVRKCQFANTPTANLSAHYDGK
jgi:hypothetical protein